MDTMSGFHRREVIRRAVDLPCEGVRERGFELLTRRILDLSPAGAFFFTDHPAVQLGEEVWLSFPIPRASEWMHARALVVRHSHAGGPGGRPPGLGVHFFGIDTEDLERLAEALVGMPPPVPLSTPAVDYASVVDLIARESGVSLRGNS